MGIEQLLDKASSYMKEQDLNRIREAYEFAEQAHHGQIRKSGEPYILHPVAVAEILVNMQMDVLSIIAALLHDVVEDTTVPLEEVKSRFGEVCAAVVDGLTKLEKIQFRSKEEQQNENIQPGPPYILPLDPGKQIEGQRYQEQCQDDAVIPDLRYGQCQNHGEQEDEPGAGIQTLDECITRTVLPGDEHALAASPCCNSGKRDHENRQ